jgi:hypothetical protein
MLDHITGFIGILNDTTCMSASTSEPPAHDAAAAYATGHTSMWSAAGPNAWQVRRRSHAHETVVLACDLSLGFLGWKQTSQNVRT